MAKKSFYEIGSSEGYLREGFYLEVRRQINYRGDRSDFKPFLNVPVSGHFVYICSRIKRTDGAYG